MTISIEMVSTNSRKILEPGTKVLLITYQCISDIDERYARYVKRYPMCCADGEMWLIRPGIRSWNITFWFPKRRARVWIKEYFMHKLYQQLLICKFTNNLILSFIHACARAHVHAYVR